MSISINSGNNHVVDAHHLTKMATYDRLAFLTLEHNDDRLVFRDITWVVKMKARNINNLRTYSVIEDIKSG